MGFSCGVVGSHSVPVASALEGKKLYCFAVYTKNTGSTKKSYELDLLQVQKKSGVSIFACEAWDVFSDVADAIDGSYSMIQVEDAFGEFHQIKRKTGVWVCPRGRQAATGRLRSEGGRRRCLRA